MWSLSVPLSINFLYFYSFLWRERRGSNLYLIIDRTTKPTVEFPTLDVCDDLNLKYRVILKQYCHKLMSFLIAAAKINTPDKLLDSSLRNVQLC